MQRIALSQSSVAPVAPKCTRKGPISMARIAPVRRQMAQLVLRATAKDPESSLDDGFEGLLPEEDFEIPGNYRDAMSANTQLGKAVREACDEISELAALEEQTLREADALLQQLGLKSSIFDGAKPQETDGNDA